jgi:hypothetical protein
LAWLCNVILCSNTEPPLLVAFRVQSPPLVHVDLRPSDIETIIATTLTSIVKLNIFGSCRKQPAALMMGDGLASVG